MKQKNIIIGAAIVGVAGYFGYRAIKKARDKKRLEAEAAAKAKAEAEKKASGTTGGGTTGGGTTYQGPTLYQQKVMSLQTRLGIGVDGFTTLVGGNPSDSQTNKAVASWFPLTYARLGNVSPSNIDAYLALGTKKETQQAPTTKQAPTTNFFTAFRNKTFAKVLRDVRTSAYFYDAGTNSWKPTGGNFVVKSGETVYFSNVTELTSGNFIARVPTYDGSGNPTGNKQMYFLPSYVYIPA